EGVPTVDRFQNLVAEPVIYLVGHRVCGGFEGRSAGAAAARGACAEHRLVSTASKLVAISRIIRR
ncbi:MAG: glutamate--cysteine ligase, partial [Planctomycetes bacterium]|nr:glutamate--cysteine ligase [Planctomycetota bacterium]